MPNISRKCQNAINAEVIFFIEKYRLFTNEILKFFFLVLFLGIYKLVKGQKTSLRLHENINRRLMIKNNNKNYLKENEKSG